MSEQHHPRHDGGIDSGRLVLLGGLTLTAVSFSSGLIWAVRGQVLLVYLAGVATWLGYIVAHYGETGVFVDDISGPGHGHDSGPDLEPTAGWSLAGALGALRGLLPADDRRALGFLAGNAILVVGIAILAWYVRQEDFLLAPTGSGLFLMGYTIAHYFDSESGHLL